MFANLTGWHLLIILAVILLIFGGTRLPSLAKGIGQSMKIFKDEVAPKEQAQGSDPDAAPPVASD